MLHEANEADAADAYRFTRTYRIYGVYIVYIACVYRVHIFIWVNKRGKRLRAVLVHVNHVVPRCILTEIRCAK